MIEQSKLWNHHGNQVGHNYDRYADQQRGVDQRGENLLTCPSADPLIGDVIVQNTRQISALFSRQDGRRIDFGKYTGFGDGLGKRFAFPDAVSNLADDRTEFGRGGAVGEKIQRFQDRQTRFDEGVELLVENEEFRSANLASASLANQAGQTAAAGFHRIDVQSPVHELLARFFQGTRGLNVRKDTPFGIRHAAEELTHSL